MKLLQVTVIAVVVLIFILIGWYRFGYLLRNGLDAKLEAKARAGSGTEVHLEQLTDFDWESVIFLGPYNSQEMANAALGFEWPEYKDLGPEMSDSFSLLVFAKSKQVVRVEQISRCLPDIDVGLQGSAVPKEAATFAIRYEDSCAVLTRAEARRRAVTSNSKVPPQSLGN